MPKISWRAGEWGSGVTNICFLKAVSELSKNMVCFVCFFLKEILSDTRIFPCIKKFPLGQKNIMSSKLSAFPAAVAKSRGDTLFHHVSRVFVRRHGAPLSFMKESCRRTSQRLMTTPSRLGSCTDTVDTGDFVTCIH